MDLKRENEIRNKCVRKLSFRMRTEKEMRDFLAEEELSGDEAESIIEYLFECGYLNDERYALEFYLMNKRKGKATARIKREALLKGISSEIFERMLLAVLDDDEYRKEIIPDYDSALNTALKMKKNRLEDGKPLDEKFRARVARRLDGLGYGSEIIYRVIEKMGR